MQHKTQYTPIDGQVPTKWFCKQAGKRTPYIYCVCKHSRYQQPHSSMKKEKRGAWQLQHPPPPPPSPTPSQLGVYTIKLSHQCYK